MFECNEFEECEYNGNPKCYLPDGMSCPHGVTVHKLTNADRIRSMSDEELAKYLCGLTYCCKCKHWDTCNGEDGYLKWLQQPAKEDT